MYKNILYLLELNFIYCVQMLFIFKLELIYRNLKKIIYFYYSTIHLYINYSNCFIVKYIFYF